jgi:hypothetical protein
MYYKFDDETNEQIHGFTKDANFGTLKKGMWNSGKKKLHVFVDHEQPVPIEVVILVLLLTQSPAEVEIKYAEENLSQDPPQEPAVQHTP